MILHTLQLPILYLMSLCPYIRIFGFIYLLKFYSVPNWSTNFHSDSTNLRWPAQLWTRSPTPPRTPRERAAGQAPPAAPERRHQPTKILSSRTWRLRRRRGRGHRNRVPLAPAVVIKKLRITLLQLRWRRRRRKAKRSDWSDRNLRNPPASTKLKLQRLRRPRKRR